MKALAALKANSSISEKVILMFDEMYLQQCTKCTCEFDEMYLQQCTKCTCEFDEMYLQQCTKCTCEFDEMYLQQCDQYSGGKVEGSNVDGNFYKLCLSIYSSNL